MGTYTTSCAESAAPPVEQALVQYLSQFARISEAEARTFFELLNVKTYPKGHLLLREGERDDTCFFVLKGCVRQYYLVDGVEKTTAFFTEGEPVTTTGMPFESGLSKSFLACVEDCVLITGGPGDEERFFEKIPITQHINRAAVEFELRKSQEAFADFITKSPEERYLNLLKNRPALLDRVPQYQLASYLGVTPESLSRIRRRITPK
jgi:CRP-like cAMP-binding protein